MWDRGKQQKTCARCTGKVNSGALILVIISPVVLNLPDKVWLPREGHSLDSQVGEPHGKPHIGFLVEAKVMVDAL